MLRLRLLGGLALENPNDVPLGRAGQRRRLALLAILASPAGTAVARDKLLGLLWPEVPIEDARHRLSAALYDLRAALGADALAVTAEEAALVPGSLSIDVVDFENAIGRGDFASAVAVYRGPFLDGVYPVDVPEFQRWADLRRAALQRGYGAALEQLAAQLSRAGQSGEALDVWRKLQELDPYSARTTIGLMRALDAAGDRPGAFLQARAHADLLHRELDAGPDPAVERLALEMKQRPVPSTPSPIEDVHSGDHIEDSAPPSMTTAPPTKLRRGRQSTLLTAAAAVTLFVLGGASAMQLARARTAVAEPLARGTESLTAERAFRLAGEHMRAGRFDAAVDAYSRAVSEDSTFAVAHYQLAVATLWADRPGSNLDKHVERARHLTDRLGEVDGVLLQAFVEWRNGSANVAEGLYRRALTLDSTSVDAWHQLGETFFHYNPIRGQSIARARAAFETAAQLDPSHFGSLWHLAQLAALEKRIADVASLTDRLLALHPDAVRTLEVQLFRAAALGDEPAFDRAFERLRAADPSFLFGLGWRLAVFAGATEKAARVYELLTQAERPAYVRALGHIQLVYLDVARGLPARALIRARELHNLKLPGAIDSWTALLPAVTLAQAGDSRELNAARDSITLRVERSAGEVRGLADQLTALAWADITLGDTVSANARLQRAKLIVDRAETVDAFVLGARARRVETGALLAVHAGRAQAALISIDQALNPRWFGDAAFDNPVAQSLARFTRAQALIALGRTADADAWLAGFETHAPGDLALRVPALLTRAQIARTRGDSGLARVFCARADSVWSTAESVLRSYLRTAPGCSF